MALAVLRSGERLFCSKSLFESLVHAFDRSPSASISTDQALAVVKFLWPNQAERSAALFFRFGADFQPAAKRRDGAVDECQTHAG